MRPGSRVIQIVAIQESEYPKCFDSLDQYSVWDATAKQERSKRLQALRSERAFQRYPGLLLPMKASICEDCTAKYQQRMRQEGRCRREEDVE